MNLTANMSGSSASVSVFGTDLLTDGGLEAWTDADNLTNWDKAENGTGTISREATEVNVGIYSAKLSTPAGGGNTVAISQDVTGINGTVYTLTLDVHTDEITGTRTIYIYSYDPIGSAGTLLESYNVPTDGAWHSLEYEFTWGANDNEIRLSTAATGVYHVDNIQLIPSALTTISDVLELTATMT